MTDAVALLSQELATLWTLDEFGSLAGVPTTAALPVPLIAVAGNSSGLIWAYGQMVPKEIRSRCSEILEATPPPGEVGWQPATGDHLLGLLATVSPIDAPVGGPSYLIPPELDTTVRVDVVTGTEGDQETRPGRRADDDRSALQPPWAVAVREGRVVAVCETARDTPLAVEAGVRTDPEFRRQGLGAGVTCAWAGLVKNRTAFYSTSWANVASQGVARRLGLIPLGQWWQVYQS